MNIKAQALFIFFVTTLLPLSAQDTTSVSLVFVGDVMGHDTQINSAYDKHTGTYRYDECFKYVSNIFNDADFAIANLEVTLAGPPFKGYPQFSSPDALAVALRDAGINAMVTANNHCVDRRRQGLERTADVLDSLGVPRTGTFKDKADRDKHNPMLLHKNGIKIALLNYTYGTNGIPVTKPNRVNLLQEDVIVSDIVEARKMNPNKIIAFVHWGAEYQTLPNAEQKKFNAIFKNNGVHVVIGSHPHVVQPILFDEDHFVVYSLGNFVSNQRKAPRDGGTIVRLELSKIGNKTIVSDAGYYLTWVHTPIVEGKKEFMVLPVSPFEQAPLFMDDKAHARLCEYAAEARDVYKHNTNTKEYFFDKHLPGWKKNRDY
ncbi:poly-gamma-glutamate synthesis protein (capsule biosynthesis protein) [Saccharicrinis carchari]|uniref:Poly-gamma-glutamate synthesis protein (Capsule biosynthesis protein) n=1 Tax=Saccharicrinis carchari TaxID=1168039 RepID=A0A521CZH3_SACCC|nr:CapA family protein [Saccharicrinis carchari]SMO64845.1 poly-gamma-glutamate synthesis protein (capsule biosynthesis protein) [Saccharicrinis carchari]